VIEIVAYDPAWPERFVELGCALRGGLGEVHGVLGPRQE
jgi:hypothetical protein